MGPGTVLCGKYRLVALLGEGGMGSVYRAEHLGLKAPVAIKFLLDAAAQTPQALARFHREAQAAANLRRPHVVQIMDHAVDEVTGAPFIVMELMEGESVAERLLRVGRLSPSETARMVTQVARAVGRAHELGIVHRDLKPANIFLVRNDDEEIAKVLDFGIAKWAPTLPAAEGLTTTSALMGTPYYMSPEQVSGRGNVDGRSDLWALGVITFECLTGRRPFVGDSIIALAMTICSGSLRCMCVRAREAIGYAAAFAHGSCSAGCWRKTASSGTRPDASLRFHDSSRWFRNKLAASSGCLPHPDRPGTRDGSGGPRAE
jgi:serine/threonine-protein kinase